MTAQILSSADSILFPLSTFLLGIYTLSTSTDAFIASTSHLAHRLKVSETLISLITAGAEWEELAVVISALAQHRPQLAVGNVLGSCVANILGAFSLGVLAQRESFVTYDTSARIYAVVLFGVTTAVAVLWGFGQLDKHVYGALLIALFGGYMVGIGWSIYRGVLDAPQDSDVESESSSTSEGSNVAEDRTLQDEARADESTPLVGRRRDVVSTLTHLVKLLIAFVALSISGYVVAYSAKSLAAAFNISDTVFGATILSLGTTLPEKFVAVVSGYRGHTGIMVANTVGSNIFLLTLCLGAAILSSNGLAEGATYTQEIVWTWTTAAFLVVMIVIGTPKLVGLAMLLAYAAFLGLEFTLYRR